MKNFTPLAQISATNKKAMIYRYKQTYRINDVEFTLPKIISLNEFIKNLLFLKDFNSKNYTAKNEEAKRTGKKLDKVRPFAQKIYDSFEFDDYSNWILFRDSVNIY